MVGGRSVHLPFMDQPGAVFPKVSPAGDLRGHVHGRAANLHPFLRRLLPLCHRLCSRLLHSAAAAGRLFDSDFCVYAFIQMMWPIGGFPVIFVVP